MKYVGGIFLSIFITFCSKAQVVDLDQLYFHSAFEEELFRNLKAGDTNHLALMLAASPHSDTDVSRRASEKIQSLVADLKPYKIARYKPKKKIKKIFRGIHDELLLKYELENQFHSVFVNGNYNCVSATMVYALVLEEFDIDYTISETPDHVYLIALFEDEQIAMEGTDPEKGYIPLTSKLYEEQLQQLVAQELLSEEDLTSPDLEDKLNELFPTEYISMIDLVGVQYYNQSVYDYNNEDYPSSYQNAKKAHFISPCLKTNAMLFSAIVALVEGHNFRDSLYPECLALAHRLDSTASNRQAVQEEINYMLYHGIEEDGELTLVESRLKQILELIDDSAVTAESRYYHSIVMGQHYAKKGEIMLQYQSIGNALRTKPQDREAADNFVVAVGSCIHMGRFAKPLDTIRKYHTTYTVLHQNNYWPSMYGELLLQEAYNKLGEGYSNDVSNNFREFEDLIDSFPNILVSPDLVASAYSRRALKDFNSSKQRALSTINKGLHYAPGHPELIRVRTMLR